MPKIIKAFNKFMDGKKTYTGVLIALLGMFGVTQYVSPSEITLFIDSLLQLIGILLVVYGRLVTRAR